MEPNWQDTKRIVTEAIDTPPEKRAAFVHAACGEDRELLSAVERLLADEGIPDCFLQPPIPGAAVQIVARLMDRWRRENWPTPGD